MYLSEYAQIQFSYIYLLIQQAGKKSGNAILREWVAPIGNHFWHCSKECGQNVETMKVCGIYTHVAVIQYTIYIISQITNH